MVVGWHSIALVVHWHSVGSGVAKDSYNQILDFSPQWHFIDPQLIKEWKSKCWEWFFPVTGNLIFSSGRGLAQWHSSDRLATLCHWNQCPHFGQSCATQKLHPYYKTTAVADRQPKKVDHFTLVKNHSRIPYFNTLLRYQSVLSYLCCNVVNLALKYEKDTCVSLSRLICNCQL